jgi:hypothetical protein
VAEQNVKGMAIAMIKLDMYPQSSAYLGLGARYHALKIHALDGHISAIANTIGIAIRGNYPSMKPLHASHFTLHQDR